MPKFKEPEVEVKFLSNWSIEEAGKEATPALVYFFYVYIVYIKRSVRNISFSFSY